MKVKRGQVECPPPPSFAKVDKNIKNAIKTTFSKIISIFARCFRATDILKAFSAVLVVENLDNSMHNKEWGGAHKFRYLHLG